MITVTSKVTLNTKGIKNLKARLRNVTNQKVKVGFFQDAKYPSGQYVAEIAWMHHDTWAFFDLFKYNAEQGEFTYDIEAVYAAALNGEKWKPLLMKLGSEMAYDLKNEIDNLTVPPNSAAWAAFKGKNDPMDYTGYLIESVTYKVS